MANLTNGHDVTTTSIPELLQARVARTPEATAYRIDHPQDGEMCVSWSRFADDVQEAALVLQQAGLERGGGMVIQLPPSYHGEVLQQAAFFLGAAVIGVDCEVAPSKVTPIVGQVDPQLWICRDECRIGSDAPWQHLHCPVIVVGSATPEFSYGQNVQTWENCQRQCHGKELDIAISPQPTDIAVIVFTSGTTGQPRGIAYDHRQLSIACRALTKVYPEIHDDDRTLNWLPMSGLFQRMANLFAVETGMSTSFVEQPATIFTALREQQPTFLVGVPRFFEKLADVVDSSPEPWIAEWSANVRFMISGSAPLLPSVQERLRKKGIMVLEAYGISENCVPLCTNRLGAFRPGTVGQPLEENEMRIEQDGEISVRSRGLFRGYYGEEGEERASERFTDDGFYRTGDFGYLDGDGFMHLWGRKSSLIKTSTGRRIASMAVEAAYGQSPLIDQIVVFGERRKRLAGLVVINWDKLRRDLPAVPVSVTEMAEQPLRDALGVLLSDMATCEHDLADYEQIDVFGILEKPLSVDSGELTENFKLRRDVVLRHNESFLQVLEKLEKRCAVAMWAPGVVVEQSRGDRE